ncbi:hypothetical protein BC830DRAFT_1172496 [Chytriomyces sp. MP71]|nr:hypothetical protein BC830DRAFT_1172496 [Chytriomyces sp. MP71]
MLTLTLVSFSLLAISASAQVTAVPPGIGNTQCEANINKVLATYKACGYNINPSSNNPLSISGDPAASVKCLCAPNNLSVFDSVKTSCAATVPNINAGSPIPSMPSGPITAVPSGSTLPQACKNAENTVLQMYNSCGISIRASGMSFNGDQTSIIQCICKNKNMLSNVVSACSNVPDFSESASSFQKLIQGCYGVSSAQRSFSVAAGAAVTASFLLF